MGTNFVADKISMSYLGETHEYFGFFESKEEIIEWLKKEYPDYEFFEEDEFFQKNQGMSVTEIYIVDVTDEDFLRNIENLKFLKKSYYEKELVKIVNKNENKIGTTSFDLSIMPTLTFVKSSNMLGISYDEETKDLYVLFKQKTLYKYSDVPREVYDEFVKASSVGSFFFKRIKSKYECKKVGTIESVSSKIVSNKHLLITNIDLERDYLLINRDKISIPSNE